MRRVVITGLGGFLPCGDNINETWANILNGDCWIEKNTKFDTSEYKCRVASFITLTDDILGKYNHIISQKEKRRIDDTIYYALVASYNALKDSGLSVNNSNHQEEPLDKDDNGYKFNQDKFGSFITSGIGGIKTIQDNVITLKEKGVKRISPFFLPASLSNMPAGNVAIKFGLQGATMTHISACASSSHSIGEAYEYIKNGELDGCLAGGTESAVCEIGVAGFDAMNALSTKYNDTPKKASRALDKDRDGFVMGEGSVVLVLEELEHAKKRGAKIYCEVIGYGATCDAYHITSPDMNGKGAQKAMELAIKKASIQPKDIDYINLHGTSTPMGDVCEIKAIKNTFKDNVKKIAISSTKSATGHLLGATGALEAMFCAKTLETQTLPPSINIENIDEECLGLNIIQKATKAEINTTLSNSFGFGGTNGTLIFKKYTN